MMVDAPSRGLSAEALRARLVRYSELVPGLNAFVDTRNPGSEAKENFTIIGPGVAENPRAHVHIRERHGFNIGGARQPPGCVNSQHSHETAEVFVVFSGRWRFTFGANGDEGAVEAGPGTVGSVPTQLFRGFTNIGDAPGFLWVALGGDDPGRVLWAPPVFDMAERHGLKLLADGTLVDTAAGEIVPAGAALMPRTTAEQVAARPTPEAERLAACFVPPDALPTDDGRLAAEGVAHRLLIGPGAPLDWPHGFTLARIDLAAGAATPTHAHDRPEVLFVLMGTAEVTLGDVRLRLGPGDTFSVPAGAPRRLAGTGALILVRGGDDLPDFRAA